MPWQTASAQLATLFRRTKKPQQVPAAPAAPPQDQAGLARTAKNDPDTDARRAAIKQITDQDLLAEIAAGASGEDRNIGLDTLVALRKVADPGRLARIALEAKTWDIRARCCARLEDAAVLERASQQDPDQLVRKAAAAKLRIIKERPPTSPAPSFQSLFFQVGLFSRGEIAKDANEFDYDSMKVCDRFISYGEGAAQAMKSYLMACAAGQEQFGWWRNSRLLVPRIPLAAGDSPAAQPMLEAWLTQLVKAPSRIAEYDK